MYYLSSIPHYVTPFQVNQSVNQSITQSLTHSLTHLVEELVLQNTEASGLHGDVIGDEDDVSAIGVLRTLHVAVPSQHPDLVGRG